MPIAAFLQGIFGASSLILGASIALVWPPKKTVSAAVMAFGSGILISAIAFEITLKVHHESGFLPLLMGFILGGVLFTGLTQYVDRQGGFLRTRASSRRYLLEQSQEQATDIVNQLSEIEIMKNLTPPERRAIASMLRSVHVQPGDILCQEGEPGDSLYMIVRGEAEVRKGRKVLTTLGSGEVFGEMSLLTGEPRSATVIALTRMKLYQLHKDYFNNALDVSPRMTWALSRALARRLRSSTESRVAAEENVDRWREQLMSQVKLDLLISEDSETLEGLVKSSAPLAILIGTLIDNIPEAVVIGINTHGDRIVWSFLLAVFISNFPEALSSAAGMKEAGTRNIHILALWFGVVLLSGFCALLGYFLQNNISELFLSLAESIAGGAILAMLASTMMPEAYELGGAFVAFSTIAGFLFGFLISSSTL